MINSPGKIMPRLTGIVALLLFVLILQQIIPSEGTAQLSVALRNSAHTPWFFLVTLLIWNLWNAKKPLLSRVWLTLLTAQIVSMVSEGVQMFTSRHASWSDIAFNLAGAAAAIAVCLYYELRKKQKASNLLLFLPAFACLLILSGIYGVLKVLMVDFHASRIFPELVDFTNPAFIELKVRAERYHGTSDQQQKMFTDSFTINLPEKYRYPGLTLIEPFPDWDGYQWLEFEVTLEKIDRMNMAVRVSVKENSGLEYIKPVILYPGYNLVRIPINQLLDDVSNSIVNRVILYKESGKGPEYLVIDGIRLAH